MILYRLTLFLPLFAQCQASEYSDVYPVEEFDEEEEGRVHFGQDASKGQYPFVVSIQQKAGKNDWAHFCGGTILTASIILTAGHCLKGKKAKNIKVYVGQVDISKTNKKYLYSAKKLIIHKSFNLKKIATTANDIGLIKLASKVIRKIDFDKVDTAYQVCLPTEDDVPDVQNCVALGWGRDESNERQTTLQHAKFKILSAADCKKKKGSEYNDKLLFCATGKKKGGATCLGDSGGPIVCGLVDYPKYYLQFGIVSFGATDCKEFPGFYTKVKKFISWIQKNGS